MRPVSQVALGGGKCLTSVTTVVSIVLTKLCWKPIAAWLLFVPNATMPTRFLQLPLFIVVGASGVGKSNVLSMLVEQMRDEVVLLEGDILLDFDKSIQAHGDMWLRLCKNIGQSGRPVVLFASGLIPQNLTDSLERRYFSEIHHLALVCEPDEQRRRLAARPAWRGTEWQAQYDYNRWFIEQSRAVFARYD